MRNTLIQNVETGYYWAGQMNGSWVLNPVLAFKFASSLRASEHIRSLVKARVFKSGSCRCVAVPGEE